MTAPTMRSHTYQATVFFKVLSRAEERTSYSVFGCVEKLSVSAHVPIDTKLL